jgi:uncharacterized SAM-dependent methyltransferase
LTFLKPCFQWRRIICDGTPERLFLPSSRTSLKIQKRCTWLSKIFHDQRFFLCLGGTVGNRRPRCALPALRSLLEKGDCLLLDCYFYPATRPDDFLADLAGRYVAEGNCFGLQFLMACSVEPTYQHAFANVQEDDDEPTVKVIRAFYRFPKQTVLTVGREEVTFQAGEQIQFLESRRFLENDVEHQLNKYGLGVRASQRFDNHGLYLCCKA